MKKGNQNYLNQPKKVYNNHHHDEKIFTHGRVSFAYLFSFQRVKPQNFTRKKICTKKKMKRLFYSWFVEWVCVCKIDHIKDHPSRIHQMDNSIDSKSIVNMYKKNIYGLNLLIDDQFGSISIYFLSLSLFISLPLIIILIFYIHQQQWQH